MAAGRVMAPVWLEERGDWLDTPALGRLCLGACPSPAAAVLGGSAVEGGAALAVGLRLWRGQQAATSAHVPGPLPCRAAVPWEAAEPLWVLEAWSLAPALGTPGSPCLRAPGALATMWLVSGHGAPSACGAGPGVRLAWLLTGLHSPTLWGPREAIPALQSLPCPCAQPCALRQSVQGGALHRREDQRRRKAQREALAAEIWDKHPLQNRWALWFFKNDKSKTWQANLRLVTKFSTAEDFWALYSHIQLASKLTSGCDYSLFKLLCLIGETFSPYSEDICGAVINIRAKGDKIAIWTREAENRDGVTHIGRVYKERLGLSHKVVIGYQAHADTATKSGSLTKNKFVV
ncbi:eukaryotic translation initiation factor 4E type 1B isoform X2 [Lepidochelys kempii]|uniref:eukaryotic translation initiation factor 4E type 1B isoform X2 n=1 Tax=Lepidochelys kempii TaxID=8472 RepID=UPI003C6EF4BA